MKAPVFFKTRFGVKVPFARLVVGPHCLLTCQRARLLNAAQLIFVLVWLIEVHGSMHCFSGLLDNSYAQMVQLLFASQANRFFFGFLVSAGRRSSRRK